MENQHRHISGYRELSQEEIDLINEIKAMGESLEELLTKVNSHVGQQTLTIVNFEDHDLAKRHEDAQPHRWLSMARTDLQTGIMYLTRSVAQPRGF